MKTKVLFFLAATLLIFTSCRKDEADSNLDQQLDNILEQASANNSKSYFILPESSNLSEIPQDEKNPITAPKVALGKLLYHETGLALAPKMAIGEGTYSCASCHFASAGFQAGTFQGIGEGGMGFGINGEGRVPDTNYPLDSLDLQPLRSPSTLNSTYQEAMLWNGQFGATGVNAGTENLWTAGTPKETNHLGYEGVEIQAIAGLKVHRMTIDDPSISDHYKSLFDAAFSALPETERINRENAGLAIAAYERTLLANQAPFQQWLKGDKNAMSEQEKRGAILFFGDAQCGTCHTGPALNSMEFHALGMNDLNAIAETTYGSNASFDDAALGRGGFTGNASDNYKFKVPQLYNLSDSPFYGHGSTFRSIKAIVEYKNNGIAENSAVPSNQLSSEFKPLNLSHSEIDDLTAFLTTALYDSNLNRYVPTMLPSGNCFPNNDEISRGDLGCN